MDRRLGIGLGLLLACGCSGSGGAEGQGEDGAVDSGGGHDDGGDAGGPGGTALIVSVVLGADESAIPGATVALDLGGKRIEQETDNAGTAVFQGLDFAGGTAAVTAYYHDYGVISYLDLEESQGSLQIRMYEVDPVGSATTTTVQGTASNMIDVGNRLLVSATAGVTTFGSSATNPPPDYSFKVTRSTPFTLVALEYDAIPSSGRDLALDPLQWATVDHAGIGGITMVNTDFAAAAPPVAVSGTFTLPSRADSPLLLDSYATFTVGSNLGVVIAGLYASSTLGTGAFDLTGEYVDLGTDIEPITVYQLRVGASSAPQETSSVTVQGYPPGTFTVDNFLDSPEITSPLTAPVYDPITWIHHEASTLTVLRVFKPNSDGTGYLRIWDVFTAGDATSASLPDLPSSADANDVFGTFPMQGRVGACDFDDALQYCTRYAQGKPIELLPP